MPRADGRNERANDVSIDKLTDQAIKLIGMELDELYVTLGSQLLARDLPSRTAEVMSDLFAFRSLSEQKSRYTVPLSDSPPNGWRKRLGEIYDELRQDGRGYLADISQDLRKALCNDDILSLSDHVDRSTLQIIVVIVSGTLRMPVELEPISVTVSAILVKIGLRNFCVSSSL